MSRRSLKEQLEEVTEREPEDLHTLPAVLQQRPSSNGRKAKRRRRARGETRQQKNLKLDPHVARMLDLIAEYEHTSPAGVVDLFVVEGVRRYLRDEILFDEVVRESRSPTQDWVVTMPDLDELERQLRGWMRDDR